MQRQIMKRPQIYNSYKFENNYNDCNLQSPLYKRRPFMY